MSEIKYIDLAFSHSRIGGEGKPPAFADDLTLARRRRLLTAAFKRREALRLGRTFGAGTVANGAGLAQRNEAA